METWTVAAEAIDGKANRNTEATATATNGDVNLRPLMVIPSPERAATTLSWNAGEQNDWLASVR
jgi:hypothetical protein